MDALKLEEARDYALTGGGSGLIVRGGRVVMSWGDIDRRYDLKSAGKSIGITALGLAIKDGKLRLDDKALKHHVRFGVPPHSNAETGWLDDITILHLATMTAGFEKSGGYAKLVFAPGTKWAYSDSGTNWLAECITLAYGQDLHALMSEHVFKPLGIKPSDLTKRAHRYRPHKINGIKRRELSGISANVDAMARIGYLYLRRGKWNGQQIIPQSFVDGSRQ
jgi:CubicO group peptidase (beta-lactamase class C family)